jgi:hypothetical protein
MAERFGRMKIGQLKFIWSLGFGYWNLVYSVADSAPDEDPA